MIEGGGAGSTVPEQWYVDATDTIRQLRTNLEAERLERHQERADFAAALEGVVRDLEAARTEIERLSHDRDVWTGEANHTELAKTRAELAQAISERDEFRSMSRFSQEDEEAMDIIRQAANLLRDRGDIHRPGSRIAELERVVEAARYMDSCQLVAGSACDHMRGLLASLAALDAAQGQPGTS